MGWVNPSVRDPCGAGAIPEAAAAPEASGLVAARGRYDSPEVACIDEAASAAGPRAAAVREASGLVDASGRHAEAAGPRPAAPRPAAVGGPATHGSTAPRRVGEAYAPAALGG